MKLKEIDDAERYAARLFNERYVMNAKKPKFNKIFNRKKLESKVSEMFTEQKKPNQNRRLQLMKNVQKAFSNH
ncbi:hypothetical protein [Weissella muntiaci]|uniref:hypothetical protein n=1 Tax=Weissella muntiaci TaxID=2508881 RepID=UPI001FE5D191|nr:hypothetical protein [Weissella muntiaci]